MTPKYIVAVLFLTVSGLAHADALTEARINRLENLNLSLERQIQNLNYRLTVVEENMGTRRPVPPVDTEPYKAYCYVVDGAYKKTFLAEGRNKTEATANAREKCGSEISSSYCTGAAVCDDNRSAPNYSGYVCMVIDGAYKHTYKGEGRTSADASAKARMACQDNVSASYCDSKPTCEGIPR